MIFDHNYNFYFVIFLSFFQILFLFFVLYYYYSNYFLLNQNYLKDYELIHKEQIKLLLELEHADNKLTLNL